MDIKTRNRTELKSYFVKNAIPTESQFAELIDGMLNPQEDRVVKLPGDPLSIEAAGGQGSKALNFYHNFSDPSPAWTLSLNPRSDPADPATASDGFCISDGQGNSRLFIDRSTGNVGIGTTSPAGELEVKGSLHADKYVVQDKVDGGSTKGIWMWSLSDSNWGIYMGRPGAGKSLAGGNAIDGAGFNSYSLRLRTYHASNTGLIYENSKEELNLSVRGSDGLTYIRGNVGIGTKTPAARLDVEGINHWNLDSTEGDLRVGNNTYRLKMGVALGGTGAGDAYIRVQGGTDRLMIGAGNVPDVLNVTNNRVGINTRGPAEALEVNGRVKSGALTIGPWPVNRGYVFFGTNALNQSKNENYALLQDAGGSGTGRTYLNSPVDIRFRIKNNEKMTLANNGSVGIGTTSPRGKLEVRGDIVLGNTSQGREKLFLTSADYTHFIRAKDWWTEFFSHPNEGWRFYSYNGRTTTEIARIWCRNGHLDLKGSVRNLSDIRLKKDITKLDNSLSGLAKLRGVRFKWNDVADGPHKIGLIAQEVEQVYPELVSEGLDGMKAINYSGFVPLLIEAVNQQQALILSLIEQKQTQQNQIENLISQLAITQQDQ